MTYTCQHCGNIARQVHTAHQHSLACGKAAKASKRTRDPRQWTDDGQGGIHRVFKRYGTDLDLFIRPDPEEGYMVIVTDSVREERVARHNILAAQRVALALGMSWEA